MVRDDLAANGHVIAVELFQCSAEEEACHRASLIALNLRWKSHRAVAVVAESDLHNFKLRRCPATARGTMAGCAFRCAWAGAPTRLPSSSTSRWPPPAARRQPTR